MTEVIQQQLEDLKMRMADLEKAEIKLRIQAVGPRGPMGPPGFHSNVPGPPGEKGQTGAPGRDGRDGQDGNTPSKESLESIVVQLLQEYHVLDENALPYNGPYSKH